MAESNAVKQAGHYKLHRFAVKSIDGEFSVDLIGVVFNFNIIESMSSGFIRGSAVVFESLNLFRNFRGQELVEIEYEDYFGTIQLGQYVIYAIDNVGYGDKKHPGFMQYTLYFVSPFKFFSEDFRIQQAYRNQTVTDYVKQIFSDFMVKKAKDSGQTILDKQLETEATTNIIKSIVIPKMTPESAVHFLSRNAYATSNVINTKESSQTFRFFEARDKFYFCTSEWMKTLIESALVTGRGSSLEPKRASATYSRNEFGTISPNMSQAMAMSSIIDLKANNRVNTLETIAKGGYKRKIYEFDLLTMNINERSYDYTKELNRTTVPDHTEAFIAKHMTKEKEIFIIQDWKPEDDPHFREIYSRKPIYFYNAEKSSIVIKVYGRNDIFAGSIVEVDVNVSKAATGSVEQDKQLSGTYIVEVAQSNFDGNVYTQTLTLAKMEIDR